MLYRDEREKLLCHSCYNSLSFANHPRCPRCGNRSFTLRPPCHRDERFVLIAPAQYKSEAIRSLIYALKYQRVRSAAKPLATILVHSLEESFRALRDDISRFVLIPTPLHNSRMRARGFNHASLLAQELTIQLRERGIILPILEGTLIRTKHTLPQSDLANDQERIENVLDAFKTKTPDAFRGLHCIVLDDVFTSGATAREIARTLSSAGAKTIVVLSVSAAHY